MKAIFLNTKYHGLIKFNVYFISVINKVCKTRITIKNFNKFKYAIRIRVNLFENKLESINYNYEI
jgi:hypothetical protein